MFTVDRFKDLVNSLDIQNLKICQQLINNAIGQFNVPNVSCASASSHRDINTLVDYHENFINKTDHDLLSAEVQTLGFKMKSCSDAV